MKYYLMSKNRKLMLLNQNDEDCLFEKNYILFDKEALPILIYQALLNNESEKNIIKSINEWFSTRIIPNYRDNKESIFEEYQVRDGYELANKHYALSLSDQYWLKPVDEDILWEDINYFDHDYDGKHFFEVTYGKESFETLHLKTSSENKYTTPNNTLGGQLKKAWIKIGDENYLLKGSGTLYAFEPINEVIASKICEVLDVPYVEYSLKRIQTKRQQTLVSVCKCMINSSQEIVSAYQVLKESNKLTHSIDDFYEYVRILEKHKIVNANEKIQKMLILDYLMLNEDRHLNNFGIIRNVDNLQWEDVCPIFDTGRSNNCNVTEAYWNFKEGEVKCFTNYLISSEELLNLFSLKLDEKIFDQLQEVASLYHQLLKDNQIYIQLFDEQIEKLIEGFKLRIHLLYQNLLERKQIKKSTHC
ncbi:MAG: HipA domain-containing protein [Bacillota bacterium]|nr:HipA domain-containing protein [Bacillota bacterium]